LKLFIAGLLISLTSFTVLAQKTGAGQSAKVLAVRGAESLIPDLSHTNILLATSPGAAPLIFLPAVGYDSGGYTASSVAAADVNRDGKLDLVVGNTCANSGCPGNGSVGVLLGNGDGTFAAAAVYDSGGAPNVFEPEKVAIADVNGDHNPDLLVTNAGSNTVAVLLGNGDGTFQPAVALGSGGMFPESVTVADVNGDGKLDLLVGNECGDNNCDGSVAVLLGNGDGTFQAAKAYGTGGLYAFSVAVADVNRDGRPDVLVTPCLASGCGRGGEVSVLLGNGDGTFQTAVSYSSGGGDPFGLAVADVNGDGKVDLLISNLVDNTVGVLLGNGDGTFQPAVTYSSDPGSLPSVAISVGVADVNGDGKPDLLVVNQSVGGDGNNGGAVALLLGNGDGTFQAAINYGSGAYQARAVAVADVNGDGRPDLLVVNECNINGDDCAGPINKTRGTVSVLLNNSGAPPTTTSLVPNLNPADINSAVIYTATVNLLSGGTPKGTVTFRDGFATIATVSLAGQQAVYSTSYATKGTHSITATYSGELNQAAGSGSSVLTEVIEVPHASTTVLTTSGSPSLVGTSVTFTATVTSQSGSIPDGELVTFYDGTTMLNTVALAAEVAAYTTSSLSAKTHTIKAAYAGDVNFKPSARVVTQVVNKYPTTTTLVSRPNPSDFGEAVKLTATVKAGSIPGAGTVTFKNGPTTLATGVLSTSGVATSTTGALAVGTDSITAVYAGNENLLGSTSVALMQTVKKATTTTKLVSSLNPAKKGQAVTFTATVKAAFTGNPSGTMTFKDGTTIMGTAAVSLTTHQAKLTKSTLGVGTHNITAVYGGSMSFLGSASPVVKQVMNP
jgi:hypothetical protein